MKKLQANCRQTLATAILLATFSGGVTAAPEARSTAAAAPRTAAAGMQTASGKIPTASAQICTASGKTGTATPRQTDGTEGLCLVLWTTDGTTAYFPFAELPTVTCSEGTVRVFSNKTEVSYPDTQVRKYTLAGHLPDAIRRTTTDAAALEHHGQDVVLTGLRPGSTVSCYDAAGRLLGDVHAGSDGRTQVAVGQLPAGTYLIKTATTTFKILKK